jgi:hypothetical protein
MIVTSARWRGGERSIGVLAASADASTTALAVATVLAERADAFLDNSLSRGWPRAIACIPSEFIPSAQALCLDRNQSLGTALVIILNRRFHHRRLAAMPPTELAPSGSDATERIPFMQRVLDNPFLLLFLGVAIPTVLFTLWGVMEVASIPVSR